MVMISCGQNPAKISTKNLVERETFKKILIDIHLIDAITSETEYFRKYDANDSIDMYSSIFEKHHVTQAEFDSTVSAYTRHPGLYKEIYDEVLLEINLKMDKLKEIEPKFEKEKVKNKIKNKEKNK